jgi:predicted GNAT family acetyltransferase
VRFVIEHDPGRFAPRVRPLLESDPANNVLATVLLGILDGRPADPPPLFASGADAAGVVRAAALRVPPRPMLCTNMDERAAAGLLDAWLAEDPHPVGVNALAGTARCVAREWEARTQGRSRVRTRMALHSLRAVTDPPRPARGRLVPASPERRRLLVVWWRAFGAEAGLFGAGADAEAAVGQRLARGDLWLWDDEAGEPVSLVGVNPAVAGVVRVGPVYTPPQHRCRGYASAAVAQASRDALGAGARSCLLFTDLANPTSNRIYADVGYRRFAEWEEHEFEPALG